MNILYVHPCNINYPGGAEKFVVEVFKRLRLRDYNIKILYTRWAPHKPVAKQNYYELVKYNVKLYECKYIKLPRGYPIIKPEHIVRESKKCDLLYMSAYSPNELTVCILKKAKALNKPIVAIFHCMLEPHRDMLHKIYLVPSIVAYRTFNKLHVLNKHAYNLFVRRYSIDRRKVALIPNGVDVTKYHIKKEDNHFKILWTGRLVYDKGADILYRIVTVFNSTYQRIKDHVRFIITGSGSKTLETFFFKLSQKYNNVKYLGYVNTVTLREMYASSHLYLLTSRTEGIPLRALEALASGLPIVGSNIPGVRDLIISKCMGKLVKINDVHNFCKAIKYYYDLWNIAPEEYYNIRLAIRDYIVKNFSWDIIVNKIEEMFEEIALGAK